MKKLVLTIAALSLSTAALADISSGNSDLQGWIVEQGNDQPTGRLHKGPESQVLFASEDTYGSILFDDEKATASPSQVGVGDSYGSILHSVGFDW